MGVISADVYYNFTVLMFTLHQQLQISLDVTRSGPWDPPNYGLWRLFTGLRMAAQVLQGSRYQQLLRPGPPPHQPDYLPHLQDSGLVGGTGPLAR